MVRLLFFEKTLDGARSDGAQAGHAAEVVSSDAEKVVRPKLSALQESESSRTSSSSSVQKNEANAADLPVLPREA